MADPIIYIDHSEVREGKLRELREAIKDLVALVRANEPGILSYSVYFTEDSTRMTIIHLHEDPASLAFHMKVAGPAFPKFAGFIRMLSIDIYGDPGEDLVGQLRKKAQMLGSGIVRVHRLHAGFARFGGH